MSSSPIITHWGIRLKVVMYYCEHFKTIQKMVKMADVDDAVAIEVKKKKNNTCEQYSIKLHFFHTNYGFL
jgi:hypothetical protein